MALNFFDSWGSKIVSFFSLPNLSVLGARFRNAAQEILFGRLGETNAALRVENERLRTLVTRDELTGLFVRREEEGAFLQETNVAQRRGEYLAVVMADLDHFKAVNDTYGHAMGDAVLRHFAEVAKETLRPEDKLFRHGGEEFVFFMRVRPGEMFAPPLERLRQALQSDPCFHRGKAVSVTASFGVALYRPGEDGMGAPLSALLEEADKALYLAKRGGRNRVVLSAASYRHLSPTPGQAAA